MCPEPFPACYYGLARRLSRGYHIPGLEPEDLEQEAALVLSQMADREDSPLTAGWVRNRILTHLSNMTRSHLRRGCRLCLKAFTPVEFDSLDPTDPVDPSPGPLQGLLDEELLGRIRPLLSPREALVIDLSVWDDADDRSIAGQLGTSVRAVQKVRSTAFAKIRKATVTNQSLLED